VLVFHLGPGPAVAMELGDPGGRASPPADLRHTFASILIREGADVVFVSRQLGHANPSITLRIYAHLSGADEQATQLREALQKRFGGGNGVVTKDESGGERTGEVTPANVVTMRSQRAGSSSD
jgi:hypothetical protein